MLQESWLGLDFLTWKEVTEVCSVTISLNYLHTHLWLLLFSATFCCVPHGVAIRYSLRIVYVSIRLELNLKYLVSYYAMYIPIT